MKGFEQYLCATEIIDSEDADIRAFVEECAGSAYNEVDKAVRLYYAVRDGIRYDPYYPFYLPVHYRASVVLKARRGFCVPKVSLLCAAGRACGIPSRAGFATVRNHLATRQLLEFMGSDLFVFHGFTEFFLEGKWVKATPAFNRELCERFGVPPLEFNGREDSIFQSSGGGERKFMEYVEFYGSYADIPVDAIVAGFKKTYGRERVQGWIKSFEKFGNIRQGRFDSEEPLQ
ncbi:MAG TPA: transglutaminase-like domain-containing protein [Acidobacteriota bacterium]|nr:transglutaminase-like domain-containing protein [Acidobacteriota bacterium]